MNIENEGTSHDVIDNKGSNLLSHDVIDNKGAYRGHPTMLMMGKGLCDVKYQTTIGGGRNPTPDSAPILVDIAKPVVYPYRESVA